MRHTSKPDVKKFLSVLKMLVGSWLMAAGWSFYHFYKHNHLLFVAKAIALWVCLIVLFLVFKKVYRSLVSRFRLGQFWREDFFASLDGLVLRAGLLFVVFFFQNELLTLVYSSVIFYLIFRYLQAIFARHPRALELLKINRVVYVLGYFLFVLQALLEYSSYHYYILDANIKIHDIVFFRSVIMTLFWLMGFAVASGVAVSVRRGFWRYVGFVTWSIVFVIVLVAWMFNEGILYYSGLYLSPVAVGHAEGAGSVVFNTAAIGLVAALLITIILFAIVFHPFVKAHAAIPRRYWYLYDAMIIALSFVLFFGLSSARSTPEFVIAKSFYDFYTGKEISATLDPAVLAKLSKFGLEYDPNAFYVHSRANVFAPTSTELLPPEFAKTKPNMIIVYVESFSARLSGAYNPDMQGVTPNFDAFAADPETTVFHDYYNASTPTITGILSQQCSLLPPTGHNEIENEGKLQNHHLLCLPEVLKKYAGYQYAAYVTAVDKEYANKDGIFKSMSVDKVYGTNELAQYIKGAPLSWGYSDHQLFPALWQFVQTAPQPFLMMLSTVDTHPPFDLAKDAVNYGDGKQPILNMFHTTDDAFGTFWREFKQSPFASNTIVLVVADHAIFPGQEMTKLFPKVGKQLTFYDENFFALYVPHSVLPKEVHVLSSGIDEVPTLLQIFDINIPNSFEGHSVFDDRPQFPNLLGMHELGLYINQVDANGKRQVDYDVPSQIDCPNDYTASSTPELTLCDYLGFYKWKKQMFEEGRFWKH